MKIIIIFILLILLIQSFNTFASDVYLADLNVYTEQFGIELSDEENDFTSELYEHINTRDFEGLLNIKTLSKEYKEDKYSSTVIRSVLDASELCEELDIDYLIFGYLKKDKNIYDAELRLYDHKKNENHKSFYCRVELKDFSQISGELSVKLTDYLYSILGLGRQEEKTEKEFGGFWIYNSTGYWGVIGKWSDSLVGIFSYVLGVDVIPIMPIVHKRKLDFFIRAGFHIAYSFGKNKPAVVESYLNSMDFRVPIELCFKIDKKNNISLGFGPVLHLDILKQNRHYDDPLIESTICFGLTSSLSYEYWFSSRPLAIGFNNIINVNFYNEPLLAYRMELSLRVGVGNINN